jgi:hypothetical protein
MKRVALSVLLLVAMTANTTAATAYSFDYTVSGAAAFGIDRAFDDGKNTVLRFTSPIPLSDVPTVTSADGTPLSTRVIGPYLVMPGLQRHILMYRRGIVAQVQQGRIPAPPPAPASRWAAPSSTPASFAEASVAPTAVVPRTQPVVFTSSVAGIQTATTAPAPLPSPAPASGGIAIISDELPPLPVWEAKAGSTLRTTTEAWAKQSGWTVRWLLSNGDDYEVAPVKYTGEFTDSLAKLYAPYFVPSFNGNKPLHVKAYAKPKILVISE